MDTQFSIGPQELPINSMQHTFSDIKPQSQSRHSVDPLLLKHERWHPISKEYERRIQRKEGKLRSYAQDSDAFKIANQGYKIEADMFKRKTKTNREIADHRNTTSDCFSCVDRRLTTLLRKPFVPSIYD